MRHVTVDVSDPKNVQEAWGRVVEMFPDVDCVINNAGLQRSVDFGADEPLDATMGDVEIDTNFRRFGRASTGGPLQLDAKPASRPAKFHIIICARLARSFVHERGRRRCSAQCPVRLTGASAESVAAAIELNVEFELKSAVPCTSSWGYSSSARVDTKIVASTEHGATVSAVWYAA
jgi:NAD(P)-dependent dehydrogenase (short-subunit alcohol dehydrogenase family)